MNAIIRQVGAWCEQSPTVVQYSPKVQAKEQLALKKNKWSLIIDMTQCKWCGQEKALCRTRPIFCRFIEFLAHPHASPTPYHIPFQFAPFFLLPMPEHACPEIAELFPQFCVRVCWIPDLACQERQTPATSGTTNIGFLKN